MKEFEVNCINKPDRTNAHEHITHIGNVAGQWRITRELAIRKIDAKEEAFYTIDRSIWKQSIHGRRQRRRQQSPVSQDPRRWQVEGQSAGFGRM
jgi:hypothetical protein